MRTHLDRLFAGSGDDLGTSDKSWNMITMSGNAYKYWEKAYFGLKWYDEVTTETATVEGKEVEYTLFRVQWHWLPTKVLDALPSQLVDRRGDQVLARRLVKLDTLEDVRSITSTLSEAINDPPVQHNTEKATLRDSDG